MQDVHAVLGYIGAIILGVAALSGIVFMLLEHATGHSIRSKLKRDDP